MTLEEKISYIKENKKVAIAAINSVLDRIYGIKENFFDGDELKEGLERDEKAETELKKLFKDAEKYEKVRRKLLDDDFNLSLLEVNYVALSYFYLSTYWKKMIERLNKAINEADTALKILMDKKS